MERRQGLGVRIRFSNVLGQPLACVINKPHSVRDKPEAPLICAVHCRKIYDDALFGNPKRDSEAVMEVACALYNLRVIYRHPLSKFDLLNFVSDA